MGKIVKGLLYLLGLLISLIITMVIAIPLFVDPNDYRDEIARIVAEKSGRKLEIKGEIGLSLFPWIGIELGEMSLSNARGFEDKPFARVEKVDIKIKLLPLLHKAVEMNTIVLHGMSLNLAKNSAGGDNWRDLAQPHGQPAASAVAQPSTTELPQSPPSVQEASPTTMLTALAINGLEINNAQISWDDQSQQQQIEISHLNLTSGAISLNSAFPLKLDFTTTIQSGAEAPPMVGTIALQTEIKLDVDGQQYQLNQLQLKADLKSPQLPDGQLHAEINGNFSADLLLQLAQADGLRISLLGLELAVNSHISQLDKAPEIDGDLSFKVVQAAPLMKLLGDGLPETLNNAVLEKTAISSRFNVKLASQQVGLEQFLLHFDQSNIKGRASVTGFSNSAIRYDIDIDQINLDRYLPASTDPAQSTTPAAITTSQPQTDEPLPIPVELLRSLDIEGSLRLGALRLMNLHTRKMVATVKAKAGEIQLAPLSAELYQGQFAGEVRVDLRNKVPTIQINEQLTGVEAGPLLKDLLGKDYLSGKTLLTANLTTRGDRISQFKQTLNGKAEVRFEDGAVNGIDIAQLIRDAYAAYKKQPSEKPVEKPQTDFALLSASINIKDGLVSNNDLSAQSPLLRVTGAGQVDLVTETIDYRVSAAIVNTLEGQGGKALSDLKGLTIPLLIKGAMTAPKISVDMARLLDEKAKAKVDAAKESVKQETQQKIDNKKEDLKNKLKEKFRLKF
jgi:AsmA protein